MTKRIHISISRAEAVTIMMALRRAADWSEPIDKNAVTNARAEKELIKSFRRVDSSIRTRLKWACVAHEKTQAQK